MLIEFYVCSNMKNHWNQFHFMVMFWSRTFHFSEGCHQHCGCSTPWNLRHQTHIENYNILAKIFPLNLKFCGLHQYECSFKNWNRYSNWDTVCFGWWMGLHCYGNWNWNWEILLGNPFPQSLHTFLGFEFHTGKEYWLNIGFCLWREL